MFARVIARSFRVTSTNPSYARYLTSSIPKDSKPKYVKQSTGLTGLPVQPNARNILIKLYNQILEDVKQIPEESFYRRSVEATNTYRLKICLENEGIIDIEKKIAFGRVEQLITFAEDELSLIPKMLEWEPWITTEPKDTSELWKPWEEDVEHRFNTKPPNPDLVELTPEDIAALQAKRPRRTRLAQQAAAASNVQQSTPEKK